MGGVFHFAIGAVVQYKLIFDAWVAAGSSLSVGVLESVLVRWPTSGFRDNTTV